MLYRSVRVLSESFEAADWAECMVQFGDGSYDAEEARS